MAAIVAILLVSLFKFSVLHPDGVANLGTACQTLPIFTFLKPTYLQTGEARSPSQTEAQLGVVGEEGADHQPCIDDASDLDKMVPNGK